MPFAVRLSPLSVIIYYCGLVGCIFIIACTSHVMWLEQADSIYHWERDLLPLVLGYCDAMLWSAAATNFWINFVKACVLKESNGVGIVDDSAIMNWGWIKAELFADLWSNTEYWMATTVLAMIAGVAYMLH